MELIRGRVKDTNIPEDCWDSVLQKKGRIEGHSHPFFGDLRPSAADRRALGQLPWQDYGVIIDPSGKKAKFNARGTVLYLQEESHRDQDYYDKIFGEE